MSPRRIYGVTKKERLRLEREASLNHHIPDILIDRLENLRNVKHLNLLAEFGEKYKDAGFNELEEEYCFIRDEICKLMEFTFSNSFAEVVEKGMRAAIAVPNFEGAVREQFIHPFQNFLLGIIIIDHFYEDFTRWFSPELCESTQKCVEASWLLASIFHDRLKPLQRFKGLIEFEEGKIDIVIPDEERYIQAMASLYQHLTAAIPLESWSQTPVPDHLCTLLHEYSEADNHGVRSSFALLKHLRSVFGENAFDPSYVLAALSIGIHDHKLRNSLLSAGIFPLDITYFPVPCLLLYCDTVQEWGRKRTYETETKLVDLKIVDSTVVCEVAFDRNDSAHRKLDEIGEVKRCIRSSDHIDFEFSPRVHVST